MESLLDVICMSSVESFEFLDEFCEEFLGSFGMHFVEKTFREIFWMNSVESLGNLLDDFGIRDVSAQPALEPPFGCQLCESENTNPTSAP